jgi:hypothetical protein
MIFFIIIIVVAVIVFLSVGSTGHWGDGITLVIASALLTFTILTFTCIIWSNLVQDTADKTESIKWTTNVYSVTDNNRYFGYGWGRGNEQWHYYCMVKDSKGLRVMQLPADSTYIQFTDNQPYVECLNVEYESAVLREMCFALEPEYILYLPKDAIKVQYNVDMEE